MDGVAKAVRKGRSHSIGVRQGVEEVRGIGADSAAKDRALVMAG
jgi:hypothetical protein